MPKTARLAVAGLPHDVIQHGLRSMNIFDDDADREAYLGFLPGAAEAYALQRKPVGSKLLYVLSHFVAFGSSHGREPVVCGVAYRRSPGRGD